MGRATIPRVPQMSQSIPEDPVFPALLRLARRGSRWYVGEPCGKASSESLEGNHRSLDPSKGKRDTAASTREESARACPQLRRGLSLLGSLQKYPKIHVSTGEESSGSGTESTQGLRPRHRRKRNSERLSSYSHGDWPFLRSQERVPKVPIVSREHQSQLTKIHEVLPSRRDEVHFR